MDERGASASTGGEYAAQASDTLASRGLSDARIGPLSRMRLLVARLGLGADICIATAAEKRLSRKKQ